MPNRTETKRTVKKIGPAPSSKDDKHKPWIAMRAALRLITLVSLGMAILVAYTAVPQKGWLTGILLSIGFAAGIWLIFLMTYYLQTRLRK